MNQKNLNITKAYGRESYDLKLKEGQMIRFIDADGYQVGQLEIREGRLYLMKHGTLKGHDWSTGEHFGMSKEEYKQDVSTKEARE
jgi:hypothetical protein